VGGLGEEAASVSKDP